MKTNLSEELNWFNSINANDDLIKQNGPHSEKKPKTYKLQSIK